MPDYTNTRQEGKSAPLDLAEDSDKHRSSKMVRTMKKKGLQSSEENDYLIKVIMQKKKKSSGKT